MFESFRLLYGSTHPTLRCEEVPLLISVGFEVVPVLSHWQVFEELDPDTDDERSSRYPRWRHACSIPQDDLEAIRKIDVFRWSEQGRAGEVTRDEADLLNRSFDAIYVPNMLNALPRILSWFDGVVVFRAFGQAGFRTYEEWARQDDIKIDAVGEYEESYVFLPVLPSLLGPEHQCLMGKYNHLVQWCITDSRLTTRWQKKGHSRVCNTSISYIEGNEYWRKAYENLKEAFAGLPLRVLGKNTISDPILKKDAAIVGNIADLDRYLATLVDCACFVDPGSSRFHSHYTPGEAMRMGVPVLFLSSSGFALALRDGFGDEALRSAGMCDDVKGLATLARRCLEEEGFAAELSARQQPIGAGSFLPTTTRRQLAEFWEDFPRILGGTRRHARVAVTDATTGVALPVDDAELSWRVALSQTIAASDRDRLVRVSGWSGFEDGATGLFCWSNGPRATLEFELDPSASDATKLVFGSYFMGSQRVGIGLNGTTFEHRRFEGETLVEVPVNKGQLVVGGTNRIQFRFPDARMPGTGDRRLLAMALRWMRIE